MCVDYHLWLIVYKFVHGCEDDYDKCSGMVAAKLFFCNLHTLARGNHRLGSAFGMLCGCSLMGNVPTALCFKCA